MVDKDLAESLKNYMKLWIILQFESEFDEWNASNFR